jgi:hypothetical protein
MNVKRIYTIQRWQSLKVLILRMYRKTRRRDLSIYEQKKAITIKLKMKK